MATALITGITGQDGSYLAELLLAFGYTVVGVVRRTSTAGTERIAHLLDRLQIVPGDVTDAASLQEIVATWRPDEVYHLASQSSVGTSFSQPHATMAATGTSTVHLLDAVRRHAPGARVYQASSSEMYGDVGIVPQDEKTPFRPNSPYGIAKVYAHHMAVHYREAYEMHVSCGIAFNHESPRRGAEFVTRKITKGVARIKKGEATGLLLGNLDARRDWGWAPDYAVAMWRILQQQTPDDYVLATGQTHTVWEWAHRAFARAGLDAEEYVSIDPSLLRPTEIPDLRGNATKAAERLGWATTVGFEAMVDAMVDADLEAAGLGPA